jgi:hypothetical protein
MQARDLDGVSLYSDFMGRRTPWILLIRYQATKYWLHYTSYFPVAQG